MSDGGSLGGAKATITLDAQQAMSVLRQFGTAADQTMQSVGQSGTKAASGFSSFEQTLSSTNVQAAGGALAGIGAAVGLIGGFAINSAMQFDQGMANVQAATGATGAELQSLSDKALQIGKDTSFSATQATVAIEELAKAGVSTKNILGGAADATVALAAAGGVALPEAATVMSAALNQYGLAAGDASGYTDEFGKSVNNAAHVADVIAGAASASATGVSEMGASLSYVGTSAAALGVPIEDTTTALALMANQGIVGSSAGTSLNQVLLSLANPTAKAAGAMQELGLSFTDINGNMLPLPDIIGQVSTATEGMGNAQRAAYLETLFGVEGGKAMNALLTSQDAALVGTTGSWDGMYGAVTEVGVAQEQAEARLNSTSGRLDALKGTLETVGIVIGQRVLPVFDSLITGLTSVLNAFLELPSGAQAVIAGVVGVAGALAGLAGAFILVGPKVIDAVQGFRDLTGIGKSAASGIEGVGNSAGKSAAGMNTANTAGKGLRATLVGMLGPVALVAAAAFLIYEAYQHNFLGFGDLVRDVGSKIKEGFQAIVDGVTGFVDRFKGVFESLTSGKGMMQITDVFGNAVSVMGNLNAPLQVTESLFHALAAAIRGVGGGDIPLLNTIADWLDGFAPKAQAFIDKLQEMKAWLVNVFSSGDAEAGLDKFSGALQPIMHGLGKIVDVAHDLKAAFGKGFLNGLKTIPGELKELGDAFKLIFSGIGQAADNLAKRFPLLGRAFSALGDLFRSVGNVIEDVFDLIATIFSGGSVEDVGRSFVTLAADIGRVFLDLGGVLASVMADLLSLLQNGAGQLFDWLSGRFTNFSSTFDLLGGVITNIIGVVRNLYEAFIALLNGDWAGVWENLQDAFTDAVQAILSAAALIPTFLLELLTGMSWSEIGTVIKDAFTSAFDAIKGAASGAWDWISSSASSIGDRIGDAASSLLSWGQGLIQGAIDGAQGKWTEFTDWLGGLADGIGELIGDLKTGALDKFDGITSAIEDALHDAQGKWEDVKTWFGELVGSVTGSIGDVKTAVLGKLATIGEAIGLAIATAQGAWESFKTWFGQIVGSITSTIGDVYGTVVGILGRIGEAITTALVVAQGAWEGFKAWLGQIVGSITGSLGDAYAAVIGVLGRIGEAISTALTVATVAWEGFKGWLGQIAGSITGSIGDVYGVVVGVLGRIGEAISTALVVAQGAWEDVKTWLGQIPGSITGSLSGVWAATIGAFGKIQSGIDTALGLAKASWELVKTWATGLVDDLTVPDFSAFLAPFQAISDTITGVGNWIVNTAWPKLTDWAGTIVSSLAAPDFSAFTAPFQTMSDTIDSTVNWITGKLTELKDFVSLFSLPDIPLPDWAKDWIGIGNDSGEPEPPPVDPNTFIGPLPPGKSKDSGNGGYNPAGVMKGGTPNQAGDGGVGAASGAASGLAGIAAQIQQIAATIATAAAAIQLSISTMKIGVVADFTDTASSSIALAGAWSLGVTAIATAIDLAVRTAISTMKIGSVTDVTDLVDSTIALGGAWATALPAIATSLATSVMTSISTMKLGVVADTGDLASSSIARAGAWQTGVVAIANTLSASVRQAISTMKIGVVADVTDTVNTSIALFGAFSAGLTGIADTVSSSVRGAISTMKIGMVSDIRDAVTTGIAEFGRLGSEGAGAIDGGAGSIGAAAYNMGSLASLGVANGIDAYLGSITTAVNSIVAEVDRALAAGLRVASPSRLTGYYGAMSVAGFVGTIIDGIPSVRSAIGRVVRTVQDGLDGVTAAQAAAAIASTRNRPARGAANRSAPVITPSPLPVTSPLPASPLVGSGSGAITINWGGITVNSNGSAADSVGAFHDAFDAELPALVTAIRRQLGGS